MTGDQLVTLLIGIFGGGVGAAIVTALANRIKTKAEARKIRVEADAAAEKAKAEAKKIAADCVATLSNAYETRLNALGERIAEVENENKLLKKEIDELKSALKASDLTNVTLQKENAELQEQIDKLSKLVNNKDRRIRELEKQVKELTERLDAMNGNADGNPAA